MGRLWSSGFELNSTTANVEFTASAVAVPTIQTTTVRSGTYAAQVTSLGSGISKGLSYDYSSAVSNGPHFYRFYLRVATLPSAENYICYITGTGEIDLTLDNTGALRLYDEDGVIGSPSSALSLNTWYRIEITFDGTAAAGSHIVRARIDGTEFAGASNRSMSGGLKTFVFGGNLADEANTTGNWYFDDIGINDSTGSFQNSYPGEGEIIHLRPNAAGDNAQWAGGTGSTFAEVDEVTPDNATTYIQSNTLNQISDFNIDATPAALASDDTINVVQVGTRFTGEDAGSVVGFALRIKASASGTVEESSNIQFNSTTYFTNATAIPRNYALTLYDLPGASTTAWTKADLDSTQIGVKDTVDPGLDGIRVSTLWLLVDHKPAGAVVASTAKTRMMMGVGI